MAAFTTMAAAAARAVVLMADPTVVTVAHAARNFNGTIVVRVLRPMSKTGTTGDGMNKNGAWDTITDDAGV